VSNVSANLRQSIQRDTNCDLRLYLLQILMCGYFNMNIFIEIMALNSVKATVYQVITLSMKVMHSFKMCLVTYTV
jgi:hypothetical protein